MNTKISATLVPSTVKEWVFSKLNKSSKKYTLNDDGVCDIDDGIPWHEADREYYKMFKLEDDTAIPTEFQWQNSGINQPGATQAHGKCKIPNNHILVMVGIYPSRVVIYISNNSQQIEHQLNNTKNLTKYIDHITNQQEE